MQAVESTEEVRKQAQELIALIDSANSARVPVERHDHVMLAFAALARCRSLLLGTVELDRAGRHDILGVTVRALAEVWYFGVIALLGDKADLDRFVEDHRYWKNDLAKQFPEVTPDEGPTSKFSVYARAQRSDALLTEIGEQPGVALAVYKTFYAGESLTSAHAGLQSLDQYVVEDEGGIGIVSEPEPDDSAYGRLRMAVVLTVLLARWTWERAGLDVKAFDELDLDETE